jgi:phosphoglucomutase
LSAPEQAHAVPCLASWLRSPSQLYAELTEAHGDPAYARIDSPATRQQKALLASR